jgi:ABC-type branched-subunit amino acid transport system ATPase component
MDLTVLNIRKSFGGVIALNDVSIDLPGASVTAIIGPNGAGKTTLFNILSGFLRPDAGTIVLSGNDGKARPIAGLPPHRVATAGIGVLFQGVKLFPQLTVLENVLVGFRDQITENPLRAVAKIGAARSERATLDARAVELLRSMGMDHALAAEARALSFGQQKLVAMARLLAAAPEVYLLDEPTAGLHPDMVERVIALIRQLADAGKAVVMIEHNLNIVRRAGDWVYLMAAGQIEVFGTPREVLRDESLQRSFPTL